MVYEDSNGAVIEKHEYAYNRNGQVVKETNLNNVSVNPVNETRSYAYDYMGNLLKSEITGSANVTTLYTYDKVGNRLTKKQNNVTTTYTYNGLNQLTGESGGGNSLINEVQYTGAIYDELTGLLYLNARFYDPATGRFISQDTYRGERDDAGTWHLYAYCANDPVNYVDPSGHNRLDSWILQALTRKSLPMEIKNAIRLEVSAGASAYLTRKGYVLSRKMFNHAIWGYGRPLSAATYRLMKEKLKASDTLKNSVRKNIDKQGTLSTEFTSGDLYYSLQHVNYKIRSKKKSGKGFLVGIIVYDDYNFDNIRRPLHVFSNAANNLGFMLERLRISYPYSFKTTFIMKV